MKKSIAILLALATALSVTLTGCWWSALPSSKVSDADNTETRLPKYETDADRPGAGSFADEAAAAVGNN